MKKHLIKNNDYNNKKNFKSYEYESDSDLNCNLYAQNYPQRLSKGAERAGNRKTRRVMKT